MEIWTPVQVMNEDLERHGEAGTVQGVAKKTAGGEVVEVEVKFDLDGETEVVKVSDLKALR